MHGMKGKNRGDTCNREVCRETMDEEKDEAVMHKSTRCSRHDIHGRIMEERIFGRKKASAQGMIIGIYSGVARSY
jgi:hypothetical protein